MLGSVCAGTGVGCAATRDVVQLRLNLRDPGQLRLELFNQLGHLVLQRHNRFGVV
jgi:hypothetical protein